jgi:hypothetical protein
MTKTKIRAGAEVFSRALKQELMLAVMLEKS